MLGAIFACVGVGCFVGPLAMNGLTINEVAMKVGFSELAVRYGTYKDWTFRTELKEDWAGCAWSLGWHIISNMVEARGYKVIERTPRAVLAEVARTVLADLGPTWWD